MVKTPPFKWKSFRFYPWRENSDPIWRMARKKKDALTLLATFSHRTV